MQKQIKHTLDLTAVLIKPSNQLITGEFVPLDPKTTEVAFCKVACNGNCSG